MTDTIQIEAEQGLRRSVELGTLQLRDDGRTVAGADAPPDDGVPSVTLGQLDGWRCGVAGLPAGPGERPEERQARAGDNETTENLASHFSM